MRKLKKDFNQIFFVRVPIIATLTPLDTTVVGIPVTYTQFQDDYYYNEQTYFECTNVMINLHKILEIFNNGYPIKVIYDKTVIDIYTILEEFTFQLKNLLDKYELDYKLREILQEEHNIVKRFITEILHYNYNTLEQHYREKYEKNEDIFFGYGYIESSSNDKLPVIHIEGKKR